MFRTLFCPERQYICRCHQAALGWPCPLGSSPLASPQLLPLFLLQPILSPSILDHLINNDRKLPPEYNLPHTYVEMQVRGPSQAGGPRGRAGCGLGYVLLHKSLGSPRSWRESPAPSQIRLSPAAAPRKSHTRQASVST